MKKKDKELKIKISVPDRIEDCNIVQISKFISITQEYKIKGAEDLMRNFPAIVQIVHIFSGLETHKINMLPVTMVNDFFLHILKMVSIERNEQPPEEITIKGKTYVYHLDFKKISTGQIIDIKMLENPHKEPGKLMAILYVEKGMRYHQTNEQGHVLNPTDERAKIFNEHFPVVDFLSCLDFFLRIYEGTSLLIAQNNSIKVTRTMKKMLKELKKEAKKTVRSGTDGRKMYTRWQKKRDEVSKKLQKGRM